MKMPAFLSSLLSSLFVFLIFTKKSNKSIKLQDLYKIIGNVAKNSNQDGYIKSVGESIEENRLGDYIKIEETGSIGGRVTDMNREYNSIYEIIIKNMTIDISVGNYERYSKGEIKKFTFEAALKEEKPSEIIKGIDIIFENNNFVVSKIEEEDASRIELANFIFDVEYGVHLQFKQNKFRTERSKKNGRLYRLYMELSARHQMSMIRLIDNEFKDTCELIISGASGASGASDASDASGASKVKQGVVFLKNNTIPLLKINSVDYSLAGKNVIDILELDTNIQPIYWGAYQQLSATEEQAYASQRIFDKLKEHAIRSNNKWLEAIFRRELLKAEAKLISKEGVHALQDRVILWWSRWVSDYGISWIRPLSLLIGINALFAFWIMCLLFQGVTCATSTTWLLLFAEFFNPLSSLTETVEEIDGSLISPSGLSEQPDGDVSKKVSRGLLSSINVVQKIFLGIFYYEIIKIFRRFSN